MKKKLEDVLFNGYVREPIPMFVLPVLVGICALGLALWGTIQYFFPESGTTMQTTGSLISYELEGPIYVLTFSDNYYYDIPKSVIENEEFLDQMIESKDVLSIAFTTVSEELKKREIDALSTAEGIPVIPSDIIERAEAKNALRGFIILWAFCLIYWSMCISGYYFISHNDKSDMHYRIACFLVRERFRYF